MLDQSLIPQGNCSNYLGNQFWSIPAVNVFSFNLSIVGLMYLLFLCFFVFFCLNYSDIKKLVNSQAQRLLVDWGKGVNAKCSLTGHWGQTTYCFLLQVTTQRQTVQQKRF